MALTFRAAASMCSRVVHARGTSVCFLAARATAAPGVPRACDDVARAAGSRLLPRAMSSSKDPARAAPIAVGCILGEATRAPAKPTWSLHQLANRDGDGATDGGTTRVVSEDDVLHMAKLSHLHYEPGSAEFDKVRKDIQAMLGYTSAVKRFADTSDRAVATLAGGVSPVLSDAGVTAPLRADAVTEGGDVEEAVGNARRRVGDYLTVPKVVE